LATNAYPGKLVDSLFNREHRNRKKMGDTENKLGCEICIPYIRGLSEKFKRIGEKFNIKTVFKSKYTLGNFLRKTKPNIDTMDKSQCVYRIPCEENLQIGI
jgi:hypothetical protein